MNALFTGGIPVFGGFPKGMAHLGLLAKLVTLLLGLLFDAPLGRTPPLAPWAFLDVSQSMERGRSLAGAYRVLAFGYFLLGSLSSAWMAPLRNALPLAVVVLVVVPCTAPVLR